MKVQAETVMDFLDKVKAMAEDINYTIRLGDDGFEETVNYQVECISKAIEVFKLTNLTRVTPLEPNHKRYGRVYESLSERSDITASESIQLYKSQLYFALKRVVKADAGISDCSERDLFNYIEAIIPDDSVYKKLIYSNNFFNTSMIVIQEVVDEIVDQRKKAPQTKLF